MIRQFLSAILILAIAHPSLAAVRGDHAAYVGGTITSMEKGAQGKLNTGDPANLRFVADEGGVIQIPYASITSIEFGQKVGRRVGATIALGVTTLGVMALPLLWSKKKKHFLTLGFTEQNGSQGVAIFELAKGIAQETVRIMEARTGRKVEPVTEQGTSTNTVVAAQPAPASTAPATAASVLPSAAKPAAAPPSPAPPAAASAPQPPPPAAMAPAGSVMTQVIVKSQPPGAVVDVDGYQAGNTPAAFPLQAGSYKLTLRKEGFAPWSARLKVEPGKTAELEAELEPLKQ